MPEPVDVARGETDAEQKWEDRFEVLENALADRDEWRTLARELAGVLQDFVIMQMKGQRMTLDQSELALRLINKLHEKEERDAGR